MGGTVFYTPYLALDVRKTHSKLAVCSLDPVPDTEVLEFKACSSYFCVFKYARAVKRVCSKAENGERDSARVRILRYAKPILRKKN